MKQFTSEEIQAKFEKLPHEIQEAITSTEIHDRIESISKRHNLMMDQLGELMDQIGLILLGFEKSSDFVNQSARRLNISTKAAELLAQDINKEVFDKIKDSIKKLEADIPEETPDAVEQHKQVVSSLERTGNLTIESKSPNTMRFGGSNNNNLGYRDRTKMLADLENPPVQTSSKVFAPPNLPVGGKSNLWPEPKSEVKTALAKETNPETMTNTASEGYNEPLVDYLISNPIAQGEKKVIVEDKKTSSQEPVSNVTTKKPDIDPYKESII